MGCLDDVDRPVLLSPGRDVAVSMWLPWRWWQPLARLLAIQVVLTPAVLLPSLLLELLFDVDLVAGLVATCVLIVLGTVAMAWVDTRLHRRTAPKRLAGMVSITGLASHSVRPWGPSRFLRNELLRGPRTTTSVSTPPPPRRHTPGCTEERASYHRPEHGRLALIRPPGVTKPCDSRPHARGTL